MSHQLSALLKAWQQGRDDTDWVLGTVYKIVGSAYRKPGAMMLINGFGQQFGLLSGGCLEADIMRHARKVMRSGEVAMLKYDGSDEDDWSFQLNIGCGGTIYIMLQLLGTDNDLGLDAIASSLAKRQCGRYQQKIGAMQSQFEVQNNRDSARSVIEQRRDGDWLITPVQPEPHLVIVGAGIDAIPVVNIAKELGWRVTLNDARSALLNRAEFSQADQRLIGDESGQSLTEYLKANQVDAVILMSHNLNIDAIGLIACQQVDLTYVAMLGPRHRFQTVLGRAGLQENELRCPVSAPAGFDIGGQLPESIALSLLAECHASLYRQSAQNNRRLAAV